MTKVMYQLDGATIRGLRTGRNWSQDDFAKLSQVCVRTIIDVEGDKRPVTPKVAHMLAGTLNMPVGAFILNNIYSCSMSWQEIPDLKGPLRKKLLEALKLDMNGDHKSAADLCGEILAVLPQDNFEDWAVVAIKQATFYDHAHDHRQAIAKFDEVLRQCIKSSKSPSFEIPLWVHYHKAISYRRLKNYDAAERALEKILESNDRRFKIAAEHQLGAVLFGRIRTGESKWGERAMECFVNSQQFWKEENNHREAFGWRRMGQLHAWRGEWNKAVDCFYSAGTIFARHNCTRYVEGNKQDLKRFVFDKVDMVLRPSNA